MRLSFPGTRDRRRSREDHAADATNPGHASLRGLDWAPGQHVRARLDALSRRTYSVWDYVDGKHLDLCVLDQPAAGPGACWSRQERVGQPVAFTPPQGRLVLRDRAPYHLFVGDETACVAFGAMLRVLPASARAVLDAGQARSRLAGNMTQVRCQLRHAGHALPIMHLD